MTLRPSLDVATKFLSSLTVMWSTGSGRSEKDFAAELAAIIDAERKAVLEEAAVAVNGKRPA